MTARLTDHVALVTGGGSGIGAAVVETFVGEDARVVVLERDGDRARVLAARFGSAVAPVIGDCRTWDANQAAVDEAVARFGKLDCLVANAGAYDFGRPLASLAPDELTAGFEEIFAVNVLAPLLAARAAAPSLRESRGTVVVTVSCAGLYAGGGGPLYVASKHAAVGVVRQLARELAPEVRVNGVAPGFTRTGLGGLATLGSDGRSLGDAARLEAAAAANVPLQAVSDPADHAGLYVLLAARDGAPATTGAVIPSDGGLEVRWPTGTVGT